MHYFVGSKCCQCYYRIIIFWNWKSLQDQQVHFGSFTEKIYSPKRDMSYTKIRLPMDCSKHCTLLMSACVTVCFTPSKSCWILSRKSFFVGYGCLSSVIQTADSPAGKGIQITGISFYLFLGQTMNRLQKHWIFLKAHPIRLFPILYGRWWYWPCKVKSCSTHSTCLISLHVARFTTHM